METDETKGSGFALLPFLVFIAIYLAARLLLQARGEEMPFYQFPSTAAMFIAVLFAFYMGKESTNENVLTILMVTF